MNSELNRLLRELEAQYGTPVEIEVKAPGDRHLRTVGAFTERQVTVTPEEGVGAEYDIARRLGGTYSNIQELQERAQRIASEVLPPGNRDLDAPMNVAKIDVRTSGIFATVSGTYEPDGILKPHPGFEGQESYHLKIADVRLRLA